MVVAAVRVGLPEFDHRVADACAVAVENAALDRDAFAARLGRDERFISGSDQRGLEERANGLRWSLQRAHFSSGVGVASRPRSTKSNR